MAIPCEVKLTDVEVTHHWVPLQTPTADIKQLIDGALHIQSPYLILYAQVSKGGELFFPVFGSKQTLDDLPTFEHLLPDWKSASFEDTFPDLEAATKDMQQRSFSEVWSHLEVEAAKTKNESFEIFGLKFPVDTASRWGVVLIVGIQLYLWIHLYELSPKLKEGDEGWNVAWIGVYQSLPARLLFLLSTALLPIITIVLLGTHALKGAGKGVWAIYIIALLACLGLSLMISRGIPKREESNEANASVKDSPIASRSTTLSAPETSTSDHIPTISSTPGE